MDNIDDEHTDCLRSLLSGLSRIGERSSFMTLVIKEDKKERRQTSNDQINYSVGTIMARAASLLAN